MPDARELLSSYRELLAGLRRSAGPLGAVLKPLEVQGDLLDQLLQRQGSVEAQLQDALQPLGAMYELARDAPAVLRSQAKAFAAASASFQQAADLLNLQADVLERAGAALDVPTGALRSLRRSAGRGSSGSDDTADDDG
jgi:hypothetical protein